MKHLKFAFVFFICSLFVFYILASLITATFIIPDMPKDLREIIFGVWGGIYVFGMMMYGIVKNPVPKD